MIVVLDSNVFVSAVMTAGGTGDRLVDAAVHGAYELVVSPLLLAELTGVLLRPKFRSRLNEREALAFVDLVKEVGRIAPDPRLAAAVTRDPKDDYLVALASAVGVDLLVSGDKDLLQSGLDQPVVVTPRDAVERLGL